MSTHLQHSTIHCLHTYNTAPFTVYTRTTQHHSLSTPLQHNTIHSTIHCLHPYSTAPYTVITYLQHSTIHCLHTYNTAPFTVYTPTTQHYSLSTHLQHSTIHCLHTYNTAPFTAYTPTTQHYSLSTHLQHSTIHNLHTYNTAPFTVYTPTTQYHSLSTCTHTHTHTTQYHLQSEFNTPITMHCPPYNTLCLMQRSLFVHGWQQRIIQLYNIQTQSLSQWHTHYLCKFYISLYFAYLPTRTGSYTIRQITFSTGFRV